MSNASQLNVAEMAVAAGAVTFEPKALVRLMKSNGHA